MFQGNVTNSLLDIGNGRPAVSVSLNYNVIDNYILAQIPVVQPYGFTSLPPDGSSCIYSSLGQGYKSSYISGNLNVQSSQSNLSEMVSGESATWNNANFTRQLKLDGVYDTFTGAAEKIKTAAINGENTNQILIDLCAEIVALESHINGFIVAYNSHIHGGVQTGGGSTAIPSVSESSYTSTGNFVRDTTFLGQSPQPNFINVNGEILS